MKYREIKRCGNIKVSEIALGCEGFIGKSREEYISMTAYRLCMGKWSISEDKKC